MRFKLLHFVFFFVFMHTFAQYKPIDTADYAQRKEFLNQLKTKNEALIKSLKSRYTGKTGKELEKFYREFYKDFEKEIKDKDYSFNSNFKIKLEKILLNLKKKNPQIPDNLNILVAKNNTPNAFCLGDGTFVVNMGLFNVLDNEAQVASVLSHELAHYLLDHTLKSLVNEINEDKDSRSIMENLKKVSVNKSKKAFDIVKDNLYKKREIKRKREVEADSLGYVLFRNSDYENTEFYNTLSNLSKYDTISPRELKIETYKKLYNLPNQPFKDSWMTKEDFGSYNYDHYKVKLNKDSLSTHPELAQRMEFITKQFAELKNKKEAKKGDEEFTKLKNTARMEVLPNLWHSEQYGRGIYAAMQFLQDKEEENYYHEWLGKLFDKIYTARKNYNLNRYLDRIEPKEQSESYQQFLSFMWNLNLAEIKNIADYYNKKGAS